MAELLDYEKAYLENGFELIAGCDEAGRGPLAGPVACGAVIMPLDNINPSINDSKKLSKKKREQLCEYIKQNAIAYSVAFVDNQTIDEINILQATMRGMEQAIRGLNVKPEVVFVDAVKGLRTDMPTLSIIKGDSLSYNIAAASILAKTERDRLMDEYAKKYPQYGFEKHAGYGTAKHIAAIKEYGPCPLHRRSFIKNFV